MKKYINLFEILGEKGEYGLIQYLKEINDQDLKVIKRQYVFKKGLVDKDQIIIETLTTMEKALNIGYVFTESQSQYSLSSLYK